MLLPSLAGNLLPLSRSTKVAAIGPWINPSLQPSMNDVGANAYVHAYAGSSGVMVNFLDGLNSALSAPVTFVQGCESNQTSANDPHGAFAAAKQAAAAADVTVLAVGLTLEVHDQEGVGHETEMVDRVSLALPQVQARPSPLLVVPGLPHVTLIELRLALVSYQDYHILLLTLAGAAARAARPDRRGEVRGEEGRAGGRLWLGGAFRRERCRRRSLCHVRARTFSYQDHHMLS